MISIDEDARKKFENDWLNGQSISIKEYLPENSTATYIGTLEELVCIDLEFRWRDKRSEVESRDVTMLDGETMVPTRVEDYVREFPELNQGEILQRLVEQEIHVRTGGGFVVEPSEYRSRFPSLIIDESLFSSDANQDGTLRLQEVPGSQTINFPQSFGGYILTEQLGRGGMGAVYRARQPAAGREVAIKIADVSAMSAGARDLVCRRFETEAHAAASINHDHVVPIFDVGVMEGQPYYAMRLVEGGDLGAMSKAEPLEPRRAARYMLGITRGIANAHQKGMLHRDVKPQNILVDAATDRAMITDFGLARFTQTDSAMTQAGQVLGTPSFMPPEQIKDSSKIDERADVYSLGGTLYQLLTGRPPFKAADVQETLRQVVSEEPVAPARLNSDIDRDLDTICLKCLEKDPDTRYATATDLALEFERFLEGKPIVARPAGPVKRLLKWCRRHRSLAAALSFAFVSTFAALFATGTGLIVASNKNRLLAATNAVSTDSIDSLYVQISEEPLLTMPGIEPVRRRLLTRSLEYYRRLIALNKGNRAARDDRAFALAAMGNLALDLDMPAAEAESYFNQAIEAIDALPDQEQTAVRLLLAKSNALIGLGRIERERQKLDTSLERFRHSTEVRKKWVKLYPDDIEGKRKLANSLMNTGIVLAAQGKLADAESHQMRAQEMRNKLVDSGATSQPLRRNQAQAEFNLAFLELRNQNMSEVIPRLNRASSLFRELAEETMSDARLWRSLSKSLLMEAAFTVDFGTEDARLEATSLIDEALANTRALMALSCDQTQYCVSLAALYQQGIETHLHMNNLAIAEDEWTRLSDWLLDLENAGPSQARDAAATKEIVKLQLHSITHKAMLSEGLDRPEVARKTLAEALALFAQYEALVTSSPKLSDNLKDLRVLESDATDQAQND